MYDYKILLKNNTCEVYKSYVKLHNVHVFFFWDVISKKTMPFTRLIKVNAWSLLTKILQFYFLFKRKKKHWFETSLRLQVT